MSRDAGEGEEHRVPGFERQARYGWAADVVNGGRVLDAACGAGWGTAVLAPRASAAVGVDFSPAAIAAARERYGDLAEFRDGDLRALPFGEDEFDVVVCFEAIVHIDNTQRALDELCRVLRPGGVLLVSAPNPDVYPSGNPLHRSEISPSELEALLSARLSNVAVHRQQTYFASLLCGAGLLGCRDPQAPVCAQVRKVAGGAPGSELHAVAAATNGELPAEPAWLLLGEDVDYAAQREQLARWRGRAVQAEAEALALRKALRARRT